MSSWVILAARMEGKFQIVFILVFKIQPKIQQTKMLVTCQRFGDLFLFGLVWLYSSVQTK